MRSATLAGAFLRRDFAVARTYRASFVLQGFASAFVLVLLFQVGRLVDRAPTAATADLSHGYFSFAVVGTAILGLVQTALHSFAVKLGQEQATGTMEALLATPASPSAVILGSALYELAQALLLAVVVLTVGSFVGVHVVLAPVSLLGSAVALLGLLTLFAGLGVAVAAFTMAFKRGTALAGLITGALALLGGVWFPVSLLPGAVRWVAQLLPFTWGVAALRDCLLSGHVDALRLAGLLISGVVVLAAALWLFGASVAYAKRRGSLGQY